LLFSDQVPVWLKITPGRQLYSKNEVRKKSEATKLNAIVPMSQRLEGTNNTPAKGEQEFGQHRGQGVSEQDRYRVTLELCQAVEGYFGTEAPVGRIMKSSLILVGTHARLSNIDDNGCFIADENFVWRGKEVVRRAGSSARGLLKAWVELRRSSQAVRGMLKKIDVYQQPSGFSDAIVTSWIVAEGAKHVPVAIHQRDLFAGGLSESVRPKPGLQAK